MPGKNKTELYQRIRQILESARTSVARSVNTTQVVANWLIGREIVEDEQRGSRKAEYGQRLIAELSEKLQQDYGVGYSATNLKLFRQFFLAYPELVTHCVTNLGSRVCCTLTFPGPCIDILSVLSHPRPDLFTK